MTPAKLTSAITQPWVHGEHVEARELRFDEAVCVDRQTLCSFDLRGSCFNAGFSARDATLVGMSWLQQANIKGTCNLQGVVCRYDLRLDGLQCDTLVLDDARFEGVLSLDGATIGTLQAANCVFLANVSFAGITVSEHANLSDSTLMGGIWAQAAEFAQLEIEGMSVEGRRVGI